jgi:hypothetical protein
MPVSPQHNEQRRSVGFLEHEGRNWACFLVTSPAKGGGWKGHFTFRPADAETEADEIRTSDIFLEAGEAEVQARARRLGRPLLRGLLDSAVHVRDRQQGERPELRRWFRDKLAADSRRLQDQRDSGGPTSQPDLQELRSLYASYRLDQVAHMIALVGAEDFERAVERIAGEQTVDFSSCDQPQLAMLVVQRIESLLPLPPFEMWSEDFLAHRDSYQLYTHTLHRDGRLP